MAKIVKVTHPTYGETELNVERAMAVVPKRKMLLYGNVWWSLNEVDFDKFYKAWKGE